ncbi:MAG: cupin domain-containing protein [Candidatus Brocadiia bacterium]
MKEAKVLRARECEKIDADWGALTWFASGELGNCDEMTVGKCVIKPDCANPVHRHPACSEVLVVCQGRIAHSIENGEEVELGEGDVITIPRGMPHNARNISNQDAVLQIAFSSADRRAEGE